MANELVVFRDAEALAVTWGTGKLGTGVAVSTKVPDPRPDRHVKVSVTGSTRRDLAYREARFLFECWALKGQDEEAADLANLVEGVMHQSEGETVNGSFVRKVETKGGPYYLEDPASGLPRYQVSIAVIYRGYAVAPAEES
jgi:hypothetical protein